MTYIYDPLFINDHLNLPSDRQTINAWSRSFYAHDPTISTTIDFYSTYPLKFLTIDYSKLDPQISNFYSEQIADLDLYNNLTGILRDYWLLGEAFMYSELSEKDGKWSKLTINNPDYMVVKRSIMGADQYFLRPDERLRDAILNKKEDLLKNIDKSIIELIGRGENIPLDNFYLSHFVRKISPYETRGTGILVPLFQLLSLQNTDMPYQQKEKNLMTIKEAIFYPFDLKKNMTSEAMKMKLIILMEGIRDWLIKKIFMPIAKINDFYQFVEGQKKIIIPEILFKGNEIFNDLPEMSK